MVGHESDESEPYCGEDMDERSLEPIREVTIDFYGDDIPAALIIIDETGQQVVYVPMRPLVEYMGL